SASARPGAPQEAAAAATAIHERGRKSREAMRMRRVSYRKLAEVSWKPSGPTCSKRRTAKGARGERERREGDRPIATPPPFVLGAHDSRMPSLLSPFLLSSVAPFAPWRFASLRRDFTSGTS